MIYIENSWKKVDLHDVESLPNLLWSGSSEETENSEYNTISVWKTARNLLLTRDFQDSVKLKLKTKRALCLNDMYPIPCPVAMVCFPIDFVYRRRLPC